MYVHCVYWLFLSLGHPKNTNFCSFLTAVEIIFYSWQESKESGKKRKILIQPPLSLFLLFKMFEV